MAAAAATSSAHIEEVASALNVLFVQQNSSPDARQRASAWLETFQKTSAAWAVADALVRRSDLPAAARLFAAQTLRQKVEYDLDQLDASSTASLRDSLLQLLYEFCSGPKNIRTQLCLALADAAIQMPQWADPVSHLFELFGADQQMAAALLQFLAVLPEEFSFNTKIHLERSIMVARAEQLLRGNALRVLEFLSNLMQTAQENSEISFQVVDCLSSWIRSGDISAAMVCATPLIDVVFVSLSSSDLFDVSVDVVCELLSRAGKLPHDMPLIEGLCNRLLPLTAVLHRSTDDADVVRGICRMFLEAGEGFVDLIAANPSAPPFQAIVEGLLFCAAFSDFEVAKISFSFWHLLTDTLCSTTSTVSANKRLFTPIFSRLIDILLVHVRYPDDLGQWTAQERDEFRDFRHVMGDVLKDCVRMLGDEESLSKPFNILRTFFVATGSADGSVGGTPNGNALISGVKWQEIEAPLFALRAMCREVSICESRFMPEIMAMLPHLPAHSKVKYATILVIGRYAEWTNVHPEMLSYQLDYVSKGFEEDGDTIAAASQTFRDLCKYCSQHLVRLLPQLHPFYVRTLNAVHADDRRQLTEAVAHVIAAVPLAEFVSSLQLFVLPVAQNLHAFANLPADGEPDVVQHRTAVQAINELTILFRFASPQGVPSSLAYATDTNNQNLVHPCVQVVAQMWTILQGLYSRHGKHSSIAEALARLFRHLLGVYRRHMSPLLRPLADLLVAQFESTGFSCHLWVAGHVARAFGNDTHEDGAVVLALAQRMIQTTFGILKGVSGSDCAEAPLTDRLDSIDEVVEDYHAMLSEVLDASPARFVASTEILSATFECALFCLASAPSPRSLTTVLRFLRDELSLALDRSPLSVSASEPVREMAAAQAGPLAHALVGGLVLSFPRDREIVNDVAETILVLGEVLSSRSRILNQNGNSSHHSNADHQQLLVSSLASAVDARFPPTDLSPELRDTFLRRLAQSCAEGARTRVASVLQDFATSFARRNVLASRR